MLTGRQREFLEATIRCYEDTGAPVHYTKVAERLHVSKWTAYDLLTLLAREGFLGIERQVDRKEGFVGRSMVLFYPTQKAYRLLRRKEAAPKGGESWEEVKKELLRKLAEAKERGGAPVLKETLAELPKTRSPLLFCAYLILALLLCIWAVRQSSEASMVIGRLLSSLATPEITLILFVGIALGILLRSSRTSETVSSLNQYVPVYVQQVREMDEAEQTALLSFVQEAAAEMLSG